MSADIVLKPYHRMQAILHERWCNVQRRKLRNSSPTIISNNCCAGFIYHDLGLKFNSPTINLTVKNFPLFIQHLEHYLGCNLVETDYSSKYGFPTGKLISEVYPDIDILFNHYESFEEARKKWFERVNRVDYSNIFYIMETYDNFFPQELEEYQKLPYSTNKVVLTHKRHPEMIDAHYIGIDNGMNKFKGGGTFKLRPLSGKRYLDDFDYVSFLNGKEIKE